MPPLGKTINEKITFSVVDRWSRLNFVPALKARKNRSKRAYNA